MKMAAIGAKLSFHHVIITVNIGSWQLPAPAMAASGAHVAAFSAVLGCSTAPLQQYCADSWQLLAPPLNKQQCALACSHRRSSKAAYSGALSAAIGASWAMSLVVSFRKRWKEEESQS